MNDTAAACRIEVPEQQRVLEFAAFRWPTAGLDTAGMLPFAPGRWLVPAPTDELQARLDGAVRQGIGAILDVTGKWLHISIAGPLAARLLACTVDIDAILAGRGCAAATLFDCPAIVARTADGFSLWVQSSYGRDFLASAARFAADLQRADRESPGG